MILEHTNETNHVYNILAFTLHVVYTYLNLNTFKFTYNVLIQYTYCDVG